MKELSKNKFQKLVRKIAHDCGYKGKIVEIDWTTIPEEWDGHLWKIPDAYDCFDEEEPHMRIHVWERPPPNDDFYQLLDVIDCGNIYEIIEKGYSVQMVNDSSGIISTRIVIN